MFDSAKYRKMIDGDLAELLRLQKAHHERVEENSKRRKEAEAKASELQKEGEALQHQIDRLKEMAAALDTPVNGFVSRQREITATAAIFGFKKNLIKPGIGIIKGVRTVAHGVGQHRLLPTDVRDILVESGFSDSANLLSEIHAALRRLHARGELAKIKVGKRTAYRSRGMQYLKAVKKNGSE